MKNISLYSGLATAVFALLSACGGGDDLTIGAITTGTPGPTATNTNTPVPTVTNTPVPTVTNTNTPVPTATNTNTPVPTATNTNTPTPTPTNTSTPTAVPNECAPAVPSNGQTVQQDYAGVDGQQLFGFGAPFAPVPNATISYTFNNGNYTATSSDPSYFVFTGGTYDVGTGQVLSDIAPAEVYSPTEVAAVQVGDVAVGMSKSFVGYYPSDWAQRLARTLGTQPVGATASLAVKLEARGSFPNLLAGVQSGTNNAPNDNILQTDTIVTATRLSNGTVNGVANACRFSYTMYRKEIAPGILAAEKLNDGTASNNYVSTNNAQLQAVADEIYFIGPDFAGNDSSYIKLLYEAYLPQIEGTFATSNTIAFLPVSVVMDHIYGISSFANPTIDYTLNGAQGFANKAEPPEGPPAKNTFTYKP